MAAAKEVMQSVRTVMQSTTKSPGMQSWWRTFLVNLETCNFKLSNQKKTLPWSTFFRVVSLQKTLRWLFFFVCYVNKQETLVSTTRQFFVLFKQPVGIKQLCFKAGKVSLPCSLPSSFSPASNVPWLFMFWMHALIRIKISAEKLLNN